jgi:ubiquinone biosynthesis protein
VFRGIINFFRLVAIGRILAKYDLLDLLMVPGTLRFAILVSGGRKGRDAAGQRPGQRLASALAEMGPTFIKLGQSLSTRSDLIGEQMAEDLSELQDKLPPFPADEARAIVAAEFAQPLDTLFQSFEDTPAAAASIAQVHFAVTTEGAEVAVKVLRPGIERRFAADVRLLLWLAEWAERLRPRLRRLHILDSVRNFEGVVQREMDLRFEAAAAAELAQNFAGDPNFIIPEVDWQRTGRRVLTLKRIHGIPVDEVDRIVAAGIDPTQVVELAADAFFNMVFRDGFFHADLHPGNLFVGEQGEIIAVDFGITGRLDKATRRFLGELLLGFLNRDFHRVAQIHFDAGIIPADQSVELFTQAVRSIAEPILGRPLHEISVARLLGQLFDIARAFKLEAQPQMLLLQKTMLVAEGVGRRLNPQINMWHLARPLIEQWMFENLGAGARMRDSFGGVFETIQGLPGLVRNVEHLAESIKAGGLRLHPDSMRALEQSRGRRGLFPVWVPWILVLVLIYLLLKR